MPKKTKKQKLLADLRRKIETVRDINLDVVKYQKKEEALNLNLPQEEKVLNEKYRVTKSQTTNIVADYSHVKKDLIKITLFTLFALIFQGVLYYFLNIA